MPCWGKDVGQIVKCPCSENWVLSSDLWFRLTVFCGQRCSLHHWQPLMVKVVKTSVSTLVIILTLDSQHRVIRFFTTLSILAAQMTLTLLIILPFKILLVGIERAGVVRSSRWKHWPTGSCYFTSGRPWRFKITYVLFRFFARGLNM